MSSFSRSIVRICVGSTLVLVSVCVSAQNDSTGIFLNAEDYLSNHLTHSASCSNRKNKIKLGTKTVKLKIDDGSVKGTHKVERDKVFALRTCKNTFRFQDGLDYKVINTEHISLYSRSISTGGEGAFYYDEYFFSVTPEAKIQPLTKSNLKEAYSGNSEFVSYIERNFRKDYQLGDFNEHLKKYMIIYFFEESQKK